jgi:hypothetical protein
MLRAPTVAATATVLARTDVAAPGQADDVQRRAYSYVLRVQPPDGEAFEAGVEHVVSRLELKPTVGDTGVGVHFDPVTGATRFALAGDPRYDADALIARTAARRHPL